MKIESFISVVLIVERPTPSLKEDVAAIESELHRQYADFEIVLVVQGPAGRNLCDMAVADLLVTVPGVRLIQLAYAVHVDVAKAAGAENAIGDFVVLYDLRVDTLDTIAEAVDICRRGSDIVIGLSRRPGPRHYRIARRLAGRLLETIDYSIPGSATGFRCVSRRAINAVIDTGRFYHQFDLRLQKTGYSWAGMPYDPKMVPDHRSIFGAIRRFVRLLVFNSTRPLRWMSGVGLLGSCAGLLFAIYSMAVRFLKEGVVEGWTTTIVFMSMQFMLMFVILAFVSEYMARILEEQRGKAEYAIVFEKNSTIMVNDDRVNVLNESIVTDLNRVQTGRHS